MGWHQCVYGTKVNFKQKQEVVYLTGLKELLTGLDADISPGRTIFINALFESKDIIPSLEVIYPSREEEWVGYQTTRSELLSNFIRWSASKTNPFKDQRFFSESVKLFLSSITRKLSRFPYYFYNDSLAFDIVGHPFDQKKLLNFLKSTTRFYDDVRKGKTPNKEDLDNALKYTFWKSVDGNSVTFYDEDFKKEIDSEGSEEADPEGIYYEAYSGYLG
jgi:hypothetical protein